MEQALRILFVLRPCLAPPLAQRFAQIVLCEKLLTIGTSASRTLQQFAYEIQIRLALVRYERRVSACQTGIVLNGIVHAEVFEIEGTSPVGAIEEVGSKVGDEEAESRREVEGLVDGGLEVTESDVATVVGEDAVVCLCIL
jgi:hypothetical protein